MAVSEQFGVFSRRRETTEYSKKFETGELVLDPFGTRKPEDLFV